MGNRRNRNRRDQDPKQAPKDSVGRFAATWSKFRRPIVIAHLLLIAGLASRSINLLSARQPSKDSAVFAAVGMHILEGKAIYAEAWDHKPPLIHYLDALAMAVGGRDFAAIRRMENLFAVFAAIACYLLVWRAFDRPWVALAVVLTLNYLLYRWDVFRSGNYTEEYAAIFAMAGACVAVCIRGTSKRRILWTLIAGMLFSLAVFAKEPFLLTSVPWALWLAFADGRRGTGVLRRSSAFVGGALLTAAMVCVVLGLSGSLYAWLDVLSFNFLNTEASGGGQPFVSRVLANWGPVWERVAGVNSTLAVFAAIGIVAAFWPRFEREHRFIPLAILGQCCMDYLGTMLSARQYPHYYIQFVPSFALLVGVGMAATASALSRLRIPSVVVGLAVAACIGATSASDLTNYYKRIAAPFKSPTGSTAITKYIDEHSAPDEPLFVTLCSSQYYLYSNRCSATRYLYQTSHLFRDTRASTKAEKLELLLTELEENPPKFVVLRYSTSDYAYQNGIRQWIDQHYVLTPMQETEGRYPVYLYVRNRPENSTLFLSTVLGPIVQNRLVRVGFDQRADSGVVAPMPSMKGVELKPGKFGMAARFDGGKGCCRGELATKQSLDALTIAFWMRCKLAKQNGRFVLAASGAPEADDTAWSIVGGNQAAEGLAVKFVGVDGREVGITNICSSKFQQDRWVHLAVGWDGTGDGIVHCYLNGKPYYESAEALRGALREWGPAWCIGGSPTDATPYGFKGMIDEFMIFDRALTQDEIRKVMAWEF